MPVFGLPSALESSLNSLIDLRPPTSWRVSGHGRQEVTVVIRWTLHVSSPSSEKTLHYDDVDKVAKSPTDGTFNDHAAVDPSKNFPMSRGVDVVSRVRPETLLTSHQVLTQPQSRRVSQSSNSSSQELSRPQGYVWVDVDCSEESPVARKLRRVSSPYRLYRNPSFASSTGNTNGHHRHLSGGDGKDAFFYHQKNTISKDKAKSAFRAAFSSSDSFGCDTEVTPGGGQANAGKSSQSVQPQTCGAEVIALESGQSDRKFVLAASGTSGTLQGKNRFLPGFQHVEAEKIVAITESSDHPCRIIRPSLYRGGSPKVKTDKDVVICDSMRPSSPPCAKHSASATRCSMAGSSSYDVQISQKHPVDEQELAYADKSTEKRNHDKNREATDLKSREANCKSVHTQMKTVQHIVLPSSCARQKAMASSNTIENDKKIRNGICAYLAQCGSGDSNQQDLPDLIDDDDEDDDGDADDITLEGLYDNKNISFDELGEENSNMKETNDTMDRGHEVLDEKLGVMVYADKGCENGNSHDSIYNSSNSGSPKLSTDDRRNFKKRSQSSFQNEYISTLQRHLKRCLTRQTSSNSGDLCLNGKLEEGVSCYDDVSVDISVAGSVSEDSLGSSDRGNRRDVSHSSAIDILSSNTGHRPSNPVSGQTEHEPMSHSATKIKRELLKIPSNETEVAVDSNRNLSTPVSKVAHDDQSLSGDVGTHEIDKETYGITSDIHKETTAVSTSTETFCQDELTEDPELTVDDDIISSTEICIDDDNLPDQTQDGEASSINTVDIGTSEVNDNVHVLRDQQNKVLITQDETEETDMEENLNIPAENRFDEKEVISNVKRKNETEEIEEDIDRPDSDAILESNAPSAAIKASPRESSPKISKSKDSDHTNTITPDQERRITEDNVRECKRGVADNLDTLNQDWSKAQKLRDVEELDDTRHSSSVNSVADEKTSFDEVTDAKLVIDEENRNECLDPNNDKNDHSHKHSSQTPMDTAPNTFDLDVANDSFSLERGQSEKFNIEHSYQTTFSKYPHEKCKLYDVASTDNYSAPQPSIENSYHHSPKHNSNTNESDKTSDCPNQSPAVHYHRSTHKRRSKSSRISPNTSPKESTSRSSRRKSKSSKRKAPCMSPYSSPHDSSSHSPYRHERSPVTGSMDGSPYRAMSEPGHSPSSGSQVTSRFYATSKQLSETPAQLPYRSSRLKYSVSSISSPTRSTSKTVGDTEQNRYSHYAAQKPSPTDTTESSRYPSESESVRTTAKHSPQVTLVRVDYRLHSAPKKRFRQAFYNSDVCSPRSDSRKSAVDQSPQQEHVSKSPGKRTKAAQALPNQSPSHPKSRSSKQILSGANSPQYNSPTVFPQKDHTHQYLHKSRQSRHSVSPRSLSDTPGRRSSVDFDPQYSSLAQKQLHPDGQSSEDQETMRGSESPDVYSQSHQELPIEQAANVHTRAKNGGRMPMNSSRQDTFDKSSANSSPSHSTNDSPLGFACESFEHLPAGNDLKLDDSSSDEASIRPPTPVPGV